jgi:CBS domain-containing protein
MDGERSEVAMRVADILATKGTAVETIPPDATVERVAQRLRLAHIGALVVTTDGTRLKGLITERDIVDGLAHYGRALLEMQVRQIMRHNPPTCAADDTVQHVMAQMTRLRVRQMPVVHAGELRGIVSIGDLVKNRLDETEREVHVLRDVYLARH